jgi:predicted ATP-grasp superfamily ATP-dependent carboligase
MNDKNLVLMTKPKLTNPTLVIGFSGWMNAGDLSTGTAQFLIDKFNAFEFGNIRPEPFYIYNFPGSMEFAAAFRPHTEIEEGLIKEYREPSNVFYADTANNLILFHGREPNLAWHEYSDCLMSLCSQLGVIQIIFVGSVAGLTPHTREPRIICSASNEEIKSLLEHLGFRLTNYLGPAGIITFLTLKAREKNIGMINLIAEIPAYLHGYNPKCIETAVKCLSRILNLHIQLNSLRTTADEFEKKVTLMVQEHEELAEKIQQLETDYDNEMFDTEMTDLKNWLHKKGIRLD